MPLGYSVLAYCNRCAIRKKRGKGLKTNHLTKSKNRHRQDGLNQLPCWRGSFAIKEQIRHVFTYSSLTELPLSLAFPD